MGGGTVHPVHPELPAAPRPDPMPTYVYRRTDGTTFEAFQKISDDALTEDPETGLPVQRVISGGAGLQFKGDGFYLTDYVRKGKGGESKGSDSKDGGSSSGDSGSSSTSDGDSGSKSKPAKKAAPSSSSDD